jgi:putative nucleotidyltransferase with HDIG domain
MDRDESQQVRDVSAVLQNMLNGEAPGRVLNNANVNTDLQRIGELVNRLISEIELINAAIEGIVEGNYDTAIDSGTKTASLLKRLQDEFKQLTRQTNQIASGDFAQRIEFGGEFAESFNSMVEQLYASQHHLEDLVRERSKELTLLLDTSSRTAQTRDLNTVLQLFSEMLIRSFSFHTYCRVALTDQERQEFQIRGYASIRSLNLEDAVGESYVLNDLPLLAESLGNKDLQIVYRDNDKLTDQEREFLFREMFQSVLIIPFIRDFGLLGFALISEARNPARSDFHEDDLDFYRTLANNISLAINNALLLSSKEIIFTHTIESLAAALDARDPYTHHHSRNVAYYATRIGEELDFAPERLENLRIACLLHDIGKIGIRDDILLKPSVLTSEEYEEIKTHPLKAAKILESIEELKGTIDIIATHHEHFDGSGYPYGLKGDAIPLESRIISLADYLDAITTDRVYSQALKKRRAISAIRKCAGNMFDPVVVKAFLDISPGLKIPPE